MTGQVQWVWLVAFCYATAGYSRTGTGPGDWTSGHVVKELKIGMATINDLLFKQRNEFLVANLRCKIDW